MYDPYRKLTVRNLYRLLLFSLILPYLKTLFSAHPAPPIGSTYLLKLNIFMVANHYFVGFPVSETIFKISV